MADGDTVDVGDRQLAVLRPPIFDSPSTLSVCDTRSRMMWATDTFATAIPGTPGSALKQDVRELDQHAWRDGMTMFGIHGLAPWVSMADPRRFAANVTTLQRLDPFSPATALPSTPIASAKPEGFQLCGTPYAISPRTSGCTRATCVISRSPSSCSQAWRRRPRRP
ncbi:hypothetical protein [Streptomyces sp. NPDC059092]|uniref:hypothetical protein n=1 Tax=Streptomyces sp. NPDC059092 TaxID=3346725 RepID=UPI0036AFCD2E